MTVCLQQVIGRGQYGKAWRLFSLGETSSKRMVFFGRMLTNIDTIGSEAEWSLPCTGWVGTVVTVRRVNCRSGVCEI